MAGAILILMFIGYLIKCLWDGFMIDYYKKTKVLSHEELAEMLDEMKGKTPNECEKIRKKYMGR